MITKVLVFRIAFLLLVIAGMIASYYNRNDYLVLVGILLLLGIVPIAHVEIIQEGIIVVTFHFWAIVKTVRHVPNDAIISIDKVKFSSKHNGGSDDSSLSFWTPWTWLLEFLWPHKTVIATKLKYNHRGRQCSVVAGMSDLDRAKLSLRVEAREFDNGPATTGFVR